MMTKAPTPPSTMTNHGGGNLCFVDVIQQLSDAVTRIDMVISIAGGLTAGDSLPDDLKDFLEQCSLSEIKKCLGDIPEYVDLRSYEGIGEWLLEANKLGFLVLFTTPIINHLEGSTFSWGYYTGEWVYADSIEDAIPKGIAWANAQRELEKQGVFS